MNWQQAVEKTVTGLGYELVECEQGSRGLLCVTIDRIPGHQYDDTLAPADAELAALLSTDAAAGPSLSITVEDCEKVTRQLQYLLEVEGVDYARLEVSSPGVDRPLRRAVDYERFNGLPIELTLKVIFQGRKKYRGVLNVLPDTDRYELVFNDGKEDQVLGFTLAEVREARLVPVLDFKGQRRGKLAAADPVAPKAKRARSNAKARQTGSESGGHEE